MIKKLRILMEWPGSALHALFHPTPFKYLSFAPDDPQKRASGVLKPGVLNTECAVALIHMPTTLTPSAGRRKMAAEIGNPTRWFNSAG